MILKHIGLYLTQKRSHAILVASLCAFLSAFQLPTLPIVMIVVALVTLHNGPKAGFWVASWPLMILLIASLHMGFEQFVFSGLGKILMLWLLASVLCHSNLWSKTLYFATCLSIICVLLFHLFMSDLSGWWFVQLSPFVDQLKPVFLKITPKEWEELIRQIAYFGTGIVVVAVMTVNVFFFAVSASLAGKFV